MTYTSYCKHKIEKAQQLLLSAQAEIGYWQNQLVQAEHEIARLALVGKPERAVSPGVDGP